MTLTITKDLLRPKQRPRLGRGHFFSPSADSEAVLHALWKSELPRLSGPVGVVISVPHSVRGDLDNIAKFVLDALQGAAFEDDRDVSLLVVHRRPDNEQASVTVFQMEG